MSLFGSFLMLVISERYYKCRRCCSRRLPFLWPPLTSLRYDSAFVFYPNLSTAATANGCVCALMCVQSVWTDIIRCVVQCRHRSHDNSAYYLPVNLKRCYKFIQFAYVHRTYFLSTITVFSLSLDSLNSYLIKCIPFGSFNGKVDLSSRPGTTKNAHAIRYNAFYLLEKVIPIRMICEWCQNQTLENTMGSKILSSLSVEPKFESHKWE